MPDQHRLQCLVSWRGHFCEATCSTGVTSLGCAASSRRSRRSGMGNDSTHWRTGTCGMTWSTRCAVVCAFRRALHEGQKPRRLQLNTTSLLWPQPPQSPQRSRRKPWARTAAFEEGVELFLARSAASRRRTRLRPGRRRSQRAAAPGGTAWSASGRWRSQLTGAPSGARCTSIARMPPACVCPPSRAAVRIPTPARRRRHAGGLHSHPARHHRAQTGRA